MSVRSRRRSQGSRLAIRVLIWTGPYPVITMAHGHAGMKEPGIEPFPKTFAKDGFVFLLHDHRGFRAGDGQPRQDVDLRRAKLMIGVGNQLL